MQTSSRKVSWPAWAGLWLTISLVVLGYALTRPTVGQEVVAESLPDYGSVGAFTLTNQAGRCVTDADLDGQVWVADIIFTRCPGPCARMSRQMADLQSHLPAGKAVRLISLTTDPDFDHPDVLKRYADRFKAKPDQWWFLTGTKQELGRLGAQGLKFTAIEKAPENRESTNDLFIHSTILAVVDRHGKLRAVHQTQSPNPDDNETSDAVGSSLWNQTRQTILREVDQLLKES